ncbi:Auxin-responsive protein SAUR40 [Linum grandiflorum]
MESKKSNSKISDIVSLQRILKKWKRIATTSSTSTTKPPAAATTTTTATTSSSKSIKFIKRTFSFTDVSATAASNGVVPKGYVAVSVGREEMKRYVVPTEYLAHRAFGLLLREAEEEFGFQHEGVLRIPCDVDAFEEILKVVRGKATSFDHVHNNMMHSSSTASSDGDVDDRDENEHRGDHQFGFPASPVSCSPSTTASGDSDYSGVDQHYQHYQHHPQMCR